MIEFDDLMDAVFDFYSLPEKERHAGYDDLLGALNDSGIEDADGSSLCSHHHHTMENVISAFCGPLQDRAISFSDDARPW